MSEDSNADMQEWESRAEFLAENTVLPARTAQVQALTELGRSRQQIADELDISPNTVDEHRQTVKKRLQLAKTTVEELGRGERP